MTLDAVNLSLPAPSLRYRSGSRHLTKEIQQQLLNLPGISCCPRRCSPFWSCASRALWTCFGPRSTDPCTGLFPPALWASWQTVAWGGCEETKDLVTGNSQTKPNKKKKKRRETRGNENDDKQPRPQYTRGRTQPVQMFSIFAQIVLRIGNPPSWSSLDSTWCRQTYCTSTVPDSEVKDLVKYKENKSLTSCDLPESQTNQHDDGIKEGNEKVDVFLPTSAALSAGVGRAAAISQTVRTICCFYTASSSEVMWEPCLLPPSGSVRVPQPFGVYVERSQTSLARKTGTDPLRPPTSLLLRKWKLRGVTRISSSTFVHIESSSSSSTCPHPSINDLLFRLCPVFAIFYFFICLSILNCSCNKKYFCKPTRIRTDTDLFRCYDKIKTRRNKYNK